MYSQKEQPTILLPSRVTFPLYFSHTIVTNETHKVLLNRDYPIRPIDSNPLTRRDTLCGTRHPDHCRDTILAGNDSSVGNHAAHFHD